MKWTLWYKHMLLSFDCCLFWFYVVLRVFCRLSSPMSEPCFTPSHAKRRAVVWLQGCGSVWGRLLTQRKYSQSDGNWVKWWKKKWQLPKACNMSGISTTSPLCKSTCVSCWQWNGWCSLRLLCPPPPTYPLPTSQELLFSNNLRKQETQMQNDTTPRYCKEQRSF